MDQPEPWLINQSDQPERWTRERECEGACKRMPAIQRQFPEPAHSRKCQPSPPFLPSLASSVPVSPHEPAGADTVNIGILTSISTFDSRPRLSIGHALPAHAGKDLVGGELLELVVVEPHHRLVRKDYPAAVSPPRPRAPSPPAWSG